MELRHLRYFATVAEEQNITKAAARLHVSQPPLSRQIRDLEEELGVALLERSAKSVKLTEAGRVFLVEANAVLARAEQAPRDGIELAVSGQNVLLQGLELSESLRQRLLLLQGLADIMIIFNNCN